MKKSDVTKIIEESLINEVKSIILKEKTEREMSLEEINDEECSECGGKKMNDSKKKKVLKLSETKLNNLISKIVSEALGKPAPIPGLTTTNKARGESKKENDAYIQDVNKKVKEYLSFDGNDNPEFPKPIGKGEKVAYENTDEEDEFTEEYRGGGMQDLKYDEKVSPEFVKRVKKALEGDTTMGNDQNGANAIKDKVGENLGKTAEKKHKNREKEPMYVKDPQPTRNVKTVNENFFLKEEIENMKKMYSYSKKTQ